MENFWHHSLYCALAAQHLAEASRHKVQSDVVFIAALLHDVGDLLIFNQLPEKGREALLYSVEGPEGTEVYQAEREIIGFDHAQLGAEMARQWQLPEVLRECIEFHHEPVRAEKFPVETAIVHIANSLAYLAELDSDDEYEAARIDERAWEVAGLDKALGAEAVAAARAQIGEVRAVFFPEQQH
jgi:putative nucleotidyltransferase with HDIG domain